MMQLKVPHLNKDLRQKAVHYFILIYLGVLLCEGTVVLALTAYIVSTRVGPDCKFIDAFYMPAFMIIASSVMLVLIAVTGCFVSRFSKRKGSLRYFLIILTIIICLEVFGGLSGGVHLSSVRGNKLEAAMKLSLRRYHSDPGSRSCWDFLQVQKKCCGVLNYTDWNLLTADFKFSNLTIPRSCVCQDSKERKPSKREDGGTMPVCVMVETSENQTSRISQYGCNFAVAHELDRTLVILITMGIGFSCIKIFVTAFSFFMASRIENSSVVEAYVVTDQTEVSNPNLMRLARENGSCTEPPNFVTSTTERLDCWTSESTNKQ